MSDDPSLFSNDNNETLVQNSVLDSLVGEGKKFKDVEALALGKKESDEYIARLIQEKDDLRRELSTRVSLEDFLKTNNKPPVSNNNAGNPNPNPIGGERLSGATDTDKGSLSKDDVLSLVREALSVEQTKAARATNIKQARQKLVDVWGANDWATKLKETGKQLGIGEDFLQDIAARSPHAFLELVGANKQSNQSNQSNPNAAVPPASSSRGPVEIDHDPNVRDNRYWSKMLKDNPNEYFSQRMTIQRHKDALRLGDGFFNPTR